MDGERKSERFVYQRHVDKVKGRVNLVCRYNSSTFLPPTRSLSALRKSKKASLSHIRACEQTAIKLDGQVVKTDSSPALKITFGLTLTVEYEKATWFKQCTKQQSSKINKQQKAGSAKFKTRCQVFVRNKPLAHQKTRVTYNRFVQKIFCRLRFSLFSM